MPLLRSAQGNLSFKRPRKLPAAQDGLPSEEPPEKRSTLESHDRNIPYPQPRQQSCDAVLESALNKRISKLASLDYHQPRQLGKACHEPEAGAGTGHSPTQAAVTDVSTNLAVSSAINTDTNGTIAPAANGDCEVAIDDNRAPVVSRYPPSPIGYLYFFVTMEGSTRQETSGIIVVNSEVSTAQLFDRVGRQAGNREDGYSLKEADLKALAAGYHLKLGIKTLTMVTALKEEVFRSGEFFLSSEHEHRKEEARRKAVEAASHAATAKKPRISFGGALFQSLQFRKRPVSGSMGFVVPVKGRDKSGKPPSELKALHNPERPNALVLFRADYKRDAMGRLIVSVVVDPIIGDKLRPHQRAGVAFLYDCVTGERMPGYNGAILADEMGLGKTIQTVALIWTCLKQGKYGTPVSKKCLVVTPSSLVRNWCNEFEKWLGEGAVKTFSIAESTPKGDRILSRFEGEGDVLVISYDQLRKYIDRISKMSAVDLVVCDEGHRLKNAEIKTTKAVDALPSKRRVILSGTPIQNDLAEFHAMVNFVNPGIIGPLDLFKRVFEEPIMHGRDPDCDDYTKDLGAERAHYLANLTQRFILRRTQSINEKYLPAKVDITVFCRLGDEQRVLYQKLVGLAQSFASSPLVLITALKKLCNHVDLLYEATTAEGSQLQLPKGFFGKGFASGQLDPSLGSKLDFVSLLLDELQRSGQGDKLVVVSNYTQTLDIIARLCKSKGISFFQLDGNTPIKRRQELVDRFNIPMQRELVFLLSSKAGGVGLNLIGANRLVLFDPDWNPANDAQAMGRVWRDGQKKRVFIYRLLSTGTIEEKIYQRQVSKQGLSANVVDMKEDSKQHFTLEELKALFDFHADTVCDTYDLLVDAHRGNSASAVGADGRLHMQFKRSEKKSGPRMDELKSWIHVNDPTQFELDPALRSLCLRQRKLVSFLFANERDAQKMVENVAKERAFSADEGKITCASQEASNEPDAVEIDVIDNDDSSGDESSNSDDGEE